MYFVIATSIGGYEYIGRGQTLNDATNNMQNTAGEEKEVIDPQTVFAYKADEIRVKVSYSKLEVTAY